MKKKLCLLLAVLLVFCTVTGCSGTEDPTRNSITKFGPLGGNGNSGTIGSADWGDGGTVSTSSGIVSVDPSKSLLKSVDGDDTHPTAEYTLMIYMVGSNLETENGCATQDMTEMANSGLDFSRVNVLVYTGGTDQWSIDVPNTCNSVLQLGDGSYSIVAQTESRENTGDPQTFYDFLAYCYRNYPASQYALVCWDHGGGPALGYGSDELFNGDGLSMAEFALAMEASPFGENNKLAFMGFDACLMASLELVDLWSDYAEYLIASTETEMGNGWDYSFLSVFNSTTDPLSICQACVDAFGAYYDTYYDQNYGDASGLQMGLMYLAGWYPHATLSCMDLSQADSCLRKWDTLVTRLAEDMDSVYTALSQARSLVKSYGSSFLSDYDLIDLVDFLNKLPSDYRNILTARDIEELVVYSTANTGNSNGLSLYFPHYYEDLYRSSLYDDYVNYAATDAYRTFLEKYTALRFGSTRNAVSSFRTTTDGEGKAVVLVPESLSDTLAGASFTLLYAPEGDDCYLPILSQIPLEITEDGSARIPEVGTILASGSCQLPFLGRQLHTDGSTVSFAIGNLELRSSTGSKPVSLQVDVDTATGGVTLRSLVEEITGFAPLGKSMIPDSSWDTLCLKFASICPTYSEDGELLPWSQWDSGSRSWSYDISLDSVSAAIDTVSTASLSGTLAVQAQVEDVYGNIYVTELIPLFS